MKSLLILAALVLLPALQCQANMGGRIDDATNILEKKQGSVSPIPQDLINYAKGVAIFTVTKGGLGIGGLGGAGIVIVRSHEMGGPGWHAPIAFNMSGASLGAQIGFTKIRYIILLNTDDALHLFTGSGKVDWDATATGTAGADTGIERESSADLERRAVIVFRDSAGIFGGATLGGSSVEVNDQINQNAYGAGVYVRDILDGRVRPPAVGRHLYDLLNGTR